MSLAVAERVALSLADSSAITMTSEANKERIAATSMIIFRGGSVVFMLFFYSKKSGGKIIFTAISLHKRR